MAITGTHMLLYTGEPEQLRTVFRDVFGFAHVDSGDGWLIFALAPGGTRDPSRGGPHLRGRRTAPAHIMCDDAAATVADLRAQGVEVQGEPEDEGWGITVMLSLPGGVEVMLYEPSHPTAV